MSESRLAWCDGLRLGFVTRGEFCESCGAAAQKLRVSMPRRVVVRHSLHGHHDDYRYPLRVRWLCNKCHKAWHSENEAVRPWSTAHCRHWRAERGLTRRQVADALGVTERTVARWEGDDQGKGQPRPGDLELLERRWPGPEAA